ncbi:MAG TPA: histidinol-phosphate transaminase [Candidatus Binatia bacterium]|nr:histidinol-phosphate transaminase [Candidatus Binatia bacterium]
MSDRSNSSPQPLPHVLRMAPFALADRAVAPGLKAIHLAQNESPTGPGAAARAAIRTATDNLNRYPEADAATLRQAIAAAENLDADRIICGSGSMELLALLAQAYVAPGDEIVLSQYGYVFFRTVAELVGARFILAPERDYRCDIDAMLAAVTPRTRMVFLANPNNPTGTLLPRSEIERLRAGLRGDIILVIDAAYAEYVTDADYDPGADLVDAGVNTVMMRTFSKIYGLAGLRVGWGCFPAPIAAVVNRLRHPNNVSAIGIAAAAAAVADRAHVVATRAANAALLRHFARDLRALGLAPVESHANFVLVPFASVEEAAAARSALKAEGILVRPMSAYSLDQCLRITLGLEAEMQAVIDALRTWKPA